MRVLRCCGCVCAVCEFLSFGIFAMGSVLLFILRSRVLVYSTGSGVNRVQDVLSRFSIRLFCTGKTLCGYSCMYFLVALVLVCVDVMVMLSAQAMT